MPAAKSNSASAYCWIDRMPLVTIGTGRGLLYNPPVAAGGLGLQTNLTGFWSFEDTSWTDDTGNGTTLTGTGTPTTTTGRVGNAVDLDGSTDALSASSNSNILNGGSSFSVQAWVKMTAGVPNEERIFNKDNNAFGQREWGLGSRFVASNVWSFKTYNTSTTGFNCDSTVTCTTGAWVHIVGTFDSSGGALKIYINGADATSGSPALTGTMQSTASAPLEVGCLKTAFMAAGQVDQCGFWKGRVLSASDVTALYNSGNGLSYAAMA